MKENSINYIKNKVDVNPNVGVILGSGLENLISTLINKQVIRYKDIPLFPDTTVDGHPGEFVFGTIPETGLDVVFANGRLHYYEGLEYEQVYMIVDIFHKLGCSHIIITNSSGCLKSSWSPGDLMIIDSHIDATYRNSALTPIIKDGNQYYNSNLIDIASDCMKELGIIMRTGRYAWTLGPTYETPAEIKLLKKLGIQAVGMSTVPEIERAHELKVKLLALACLTNYAVGISKTILTHEEVVKQADKSSEIFTKLLLKILKKLTKVYL